MGAEDLEEPKFLDASAKPDDEDTHIFSIRTYDSEEQYMRQTNSGGYVHGRRAGRKNHHYNHHDGPSRRVKCFLALFILVIVGALVGVTFGAWENGGVTPSTSRQQSSESAGQDSSGRSRAGSGDGGDENDIPRNDLVDLIEDPDLSETAWPQLIGYPGEDAKNALLYVYGDRYNILVVPHGDPVLTDFRLDRIFIFVDQNQNVMIRPHVG